MRDKSVPTDNLLIVCQTSASQVLRFGLCCILGLASPFAILVLYTRGMAELLGCHGGSSHGGSSHGGSSHASQSSCRPVPMAQVPRKCQLKSWLSTPKLTVVVVVPCVSWLVPQAADGPSPTVTTVASSAEVAEERAPIHSGVTSQKLRAYATVYLHLPFTGWLASIALGLEKMRCSPKSQFVCQDQVRQDLTARIRCGRI